MGYEGHCKSMSSLLMYEPLKKEANGRPGPAHYSPDHNKHFANPGSAKIGKSKREDTDFVA
jgi:hypothetical protein